jgi:hypothetical protein
MDRSAARLLGCLAWWSAGVVAACNAIAGLDAEYELADNAAIADSGDGTSSGGTSGGTSSGGTSSGGTSDADADAGDAGTSTRRCPLQGALVCDDFEDEDARAPNFGWTGHEALGGTPTVDAGFGFGGSRGLRAGGNAYDADGGSAKVLLFRTLDAGAFPQGSTLILRLRFNVKEADLGYAALAVFQFSYSLGDAGAVFEYGLAVHNSDGCPQPSEKICVDENNVTDNRPALLDAKAIQLGTWYSAEIRLSRSQRGDYYNGRVVLKDNNDVVLDARDAGQRGAPNDLQVRVGMFYTSGGNAFTEVWIDDVTVEKNVP